MSSFVLVTEGITDQVALETILVGFYGDDDLDVACLQPLRDATDNSRQGSFAGWELVLEYCTRHGDLVEALAFSDYLIIQIDTDCADHVNFGVSLTSEGKDKPVDQLVEEVRRLIIARLGADFFDQYGERVVFAISVHSLECWLLPLHINDVKKASKPKSCETHLRHAVNRSGGVYSKDADCYRTLVKGYEKRRTIEEHRLKNVSFDMFLSSLPVVMDLDAEDIS